jgi:hypothetical protein
MAGLDPAIQVFGRRSKTWMPAQAGMAKEYGSGEGLSGHALEAGGAVHYAMDT